MPLTTTYFFCVQFCLRQVPLCELRSRPVGRCFWPFRLPSSPFQYAFLNWVKVTVSLPLMHSFNRVLVWSPCVCQSGERPILGHNCGGVNQAGIHWRHHDWAFSFLVSAVHSCIYSHCALGLHRLHSRFEAWMRPVCFLQENFVVCLAGLSADHCRFGMLWLDLCLRLIFIIVGSMLNRVEAFICMPGLNFVWLRNLGKSDSLQVNFLSLTRW